MAQAFRSYGPGRFRSSAGSSRNNFGSQPRYGRLIKGRPGMSRLATADINIFIKKASDEKITVDVPVTHSFNDFPISDVVKQNIKRKGYLIPTPIQDQSIEPIIAGRDVIGVTNTGMGKTAAFLIPIVDRLYKNPNDRALIVAPTRELACQIRDELRSFCWNTRIYATVVMGGTSSFRQISELRQNPQVVIATPGRLKDLIDRGFIKLSTFSTFILDEVDLMVDIGFINDIKYFINLLPKVRQSLFFSATFPPKVTEIINSFVSNPLTISLKKSDNLSNIEQNIIKIVNRETKIEQLSALLQTSEFSKVLVFGRTKNGIDKIHKHLMLKGLRVGALHGNKSQGVRQQILNSFKRNDINILLATDLASRGIDVDNISHVINYDLPATYEDYIHRIGRTGRAGKKGTALTFVD
ncbi:MAG: DEAD/DEAH box helicase [candidate division WWE3 bacterium]|nr:DEAD/DEAH box helicase [candidate division WWE3 bacterium]